MPGLLFFFSSSHLLWPLWIAKIVAIVVGPMQRDLGVGDTQIGWLYGIHALFYALGAISQLPASQIREAVNTLLQ